MRILFLFIGWLVALSACQSPSNEISLQGAWKFSLDPTDVGIKQQWYDNVLTDAIQLPGSLQEQGFGNDVDLNTKWTGQVVDSSWFNAPAYEKYRKAGNMKVPFWLNPEKHYVGVAWYQKEITIPRDWEKRPVELELERTHWETILYVDGKEMAKSDALSTPHRYILNNLSSGKHILTLRVDNRVNIPIGINAHSVSDHTQSNWNGIIGNIALTAKPAVYIDDVQLYPNVEAKSVQVKVHLKSESMDANSTLLLQVVSSDGTPVGATVEIEDIKLQAGTVLDATVMLGDDALLWSEHTPNVYTLKTTLTSSGHKDEEETDFGLRSFKADGTRFMVNGKPIFLRGTLECCIFPLTGYPSMDKAYWTKIYSTCKEFGLNHVRFHSWCPPKVAFEVADELGIYLQVECAGWATVGDGGYVDEWFYSEGDRILKEYGNHPSFCMMSYGNEPGGGKQVAYLSALVESWKVKDARHVYTSAGGWPYLENADYWNAPDPRIQGWGEGLNSIINREAPSTAYDFAAKIKPNMPTVSHEIGQWCVYPNFNEIPKYTGVLKARNLEIFQETLAANNMADLSEEFLYASGRLQTLCYKADIEAALRTPGFAGFQLLDLHDFPGQGSALVGVLDAFWDTKGYVDGKEYSIFCNATVPLVRFPKMVWSNNETLKAPIEFANFAKEPLADAEIVWSVTSSDGKLLEKKTFKQALPIGNCIPAGAINLPLQAIKKATQLIVTVEVSNTSIKNQWNVWVYPETKQPVEKMPYITSSLDQIALNKLNQGENVFLSLPKGAVHADKGGDIAVGFSSVFWNTAWTRGQAPHTLGIFCNPKHPALAAFPNSGYSDYQWWDLVSNADAMVLDDFPQTFRPIVHLVDDWFTNRKLGILFEAKVGNGNFMVCSVDMNKAMNTRPATAQFKQSILQYMASDAFNPTEQVEVEVIRGLLK